MRRPVVALLLVAISLSFAASPAFAHPRTRVRIVQRYHASGPGAANFSPSAMVGSSSPSADQQNSMLATIAAAVLPDLISRLASRLGDGANPGTPVTSADLTPVTDSLKRVEDKMATLEEALRDYTKRTVESQQEYDRRLKELDDKVKAVEVAQRAQKEDVDTKFATINGKIDSNQRQLDEILKKLDKLVPPAAIPSGAAAPGTAPPAGGSGEGPAASAVVRPKESGSDEVPTPKE